VPKFAGSGSRPAKFRREGNKRGVWNKEKDPKISSDAESGTFCRDFKLVHSLFTTCSHRVIIAANGKFPVRIQKFEASFSAFNFMKMPKLFR
jgi:hypothetical protein